MRVRSGHDEIATGRTDAILDAITVGVGGGAVASVERAEEFHLREIRGVGREENRQRHGVARDFIHEHMRGGVVGVEAVDVEAGLGVN